MNHSAEMSRGILLVAADQPQNDALSEWLRARGYAVQRAPDAATALRLIAADPPALILLDAQLPDMAGEVFCRQLQTLESARAIPLLWLYEADAPSELERGLAAGAADGLSRPFHQAGVLARVNIHLTLGQLQARHVAQQAELAQLTQAHAAVSATLQELTTEVAQGDAERLAALRASEAMFRYFLSRANEGYLIVDAAEHIHYANAQARLYLGMDTEQPAETFRALLARQYHCEPQEVWALWPKKTFAGGMPLPFYLVRPETRTARTFWLRVTLLDVPAGMDETAGRIIRLEDVTERTTLQDELNKFHAMISHKLRTPLVPLYSGLQYLKINLATISQEDMVDFLTEALTGAERLYREIEDIVRYLNTPAHRMPPGDGCELACFAPLTRQIAASLALPTLIVEVEPGLENAQTTLSEQSLELVLWEILENAQKFHPTRAPHVRVLLRREDAQTINIQIRDDGGHLSPDQLARMWIPYYQGDKFATGQIAGMGLGLSLVATQVWSVGGACRAFNRADGPGVVVELLLPLQD